MSQPISTPAKNQPSATLGLSHGYCFDGDITHLNADLVAHDLTAAANQEWALQLWASHDMDLSNPGKGIKIAEVSLGTPFSDEQSFVQVHGISTALPPAGSAPCRLFIALVSGIEGLFDTIHDFSAYPQSETFIQPRLNGTVNYTLADGSLELKIEGIENPRPADNLSGTLALELWSLNAPYQGGEWSGSPVASIVLGTLSGQCLWSECDYLANSAQPEEAAYLTLMLREWTPAGYVTRDYRILAKPVVAAIPATKPAAKAAPKAAKKTRAAEKAPATPVSAAKESAPVKQAVAATATTAAISVNKASEAELVAIKGLGAAVARAIIAGRPYASLDDLKRSKGMGEKLLAKIKSQIKL